MIAAGRAGTGRFGGRSQSLWKVPLPMPILIPSPSTAHTNEGGAGSRFDSGATFSHCSGCIENPHHRKPEWYRHLLRGEPPRTAMEIGIDKGAVPCLP